MNPTEATLLTIAIILLVGLIIYSLITSRRVTSKSAESQAESLKNMLDEYTKKANTREKTITEKFEASNIEIPTKQYAQYDNCRAVEEMGLTKEEADGFVLDLVKAINAEIPRIEQAILSSDYKRVEEIVHTITGSSSTLGSGGVSSALISFYTAVQHRDTLQDLYVHLQNIKYYIEELRVQCDDPDNNSGDCI